MSYQTVDQVISAPEKVLVQLVIESREPENPLERILQLQIQQIKDKGHMVEIPGEFV